MRRGLSKTPQRPRFHWWALVLYGTFFSALWVGYTVYSPNGPDPARWSADELTYIYRGTAIAGFLSGVTSYGILFLIQRAHFRSRQATSRPIEAAADPGGG